MSIVNIVLPMTGFAYQPGQTLSKKLKQKLAETASVSFADSRSEQIFEYLVEKKFVGAQGPKKSGRYKDFSLERSEAGGWRAFNHFNNPLPSIRVFQTDIWLADPAIESTIGVPTPDNSDEILELCFQLNLISKSKSTWTAAGQLTHGLRKISPNAPDNPMLLGLEAMALLRQIIETDGLLLRELLRVIVTAQECIRRDTIALQLGLMAERALQSAQSLRLPPPLLVEGKKFVALVRRTTAKRPSGSRAPGVLEHRMSPRLEWLADFGALTKYGLPKNSFEYSRTPDAALLFDLLDTNAESANWADDAALKYWRTSTRWNDSRAGLERLETRSALQRGYSIMRRTVGPTSIREVCFAAGVLTPHINHRMEDLVSSLLDWASGEPRLTVSGGRYTRSPELIHMSAELLGEV